MVSSFSTSAAEAGPFAIAKAHISEIDRKVQEMSDRLNRPLPRSLREIKTLLPRLLRKVNQAETESHKERADAEVLLTATMNSWCDRLQGLDRQLDDSLWHQRSRKSMFTAGSFEDSNAWMGGLIQHFERDLEHISYLDSHVFSSPSTQKSPGLSMEMKLVEQLTLLNKLEASPGQWSGTTERFRVNWEEMGIEYRVQLSDGILLGDGGSSIVKRVNMCGIAMAKKSIRAMSRSHLEKIWAEVETMRRLEGRRHMVKIVGTFVTMVQDEDTIHILTFPVADSDLHNFLDSFEATKAVPSYKRNTGEVCSLQKLNVAAGFDNKTTSLSHIDGFLERTMGCTTEGLKSMHAIGISHDDLKPSNILLRDGRVYITDFGSSRDRSSAASTSTETKPCSTRGWWAPEVDAEEEHSPTRADVYSLGCIFMHIVSVIHRRSRASCTKIFEASAVGREEAIEEHFRGLGAHEETVELIRDMLQNDRYARPDISEVNRLLRKWGGRGSLYHGSCCPPEVEPSPRNTAVSSAMQTDDWVVL